MKKDPYSQETKAIKLLQDRTGLIDNAHSQIDGDLRSLREQLASLGAGEIQHEAGFAEMVQTNLDSMSDAHPLQSVELSSIFDEAESKYDDALSFRDILSIQDRVTAENKLDKHIMDFNHRYGLDGWDYAIAGSCGLFAAMLDILCVKAPPKPTVKWSNEVDGIFNQFVQKAFNKILPSDLSNALSNSCPIGAPDSSVMTDLLGAPAKALNPINHRLRSLSHDPILSFIFGVLDMLNGTCTVITDGVISSFPSTKGTTGGNIFQLLGRMFGHLLSDVNAPSANSNRGMGLPAPFMGLLRMLEGIPVGDSNFGRQIEWMYVRGYDYRQFIVSSVPMAIMEVMLRVFYVVKQMKLHSVSFGDTLLDTMPMRMNPRFRMMLALSYGTCSCINAGKMYVTQNILDANYASWMGLAWNGCHALKWALLDKHLKLWEEIEAKEIAELEDIVERLDMLSARATRLPV